MTHAQILKATHAKVVHYIALETAIAAGISWHQLRNFVANTAGLSDSELYRLAAVIHVEQSR